MRRECIYNIGLHLVNHNIFSIINLDLKVLFVLKPEETAYIILKLHLINI